MGCCVISTVRRRCSGRTAPPQIGFQLCAAGSDVADWSFAGEEGVRLGRSDPQMPCGHCIEVNARRASDADGSKLVANWLFAPALIGRYQARDLAQSWFSALEALARHAAQPGAAGAHRPLPPVSHLQLGTY